MVATVQESKSLLVIICDTKEGSTKLLLALCRNEGNSLGGAFSEVLNFIIKI